MDHASRASTLLFEFGKCPSAAAIASPACEGLLVETEDCASQFLAEQLPCASRIGEIVFAANRTRTIQRRKAGRKDTHF